MFGGILVSFLFGKYASAILLFINSPQNAFVGQYPPEVCGIKRRLVFFRHFVSGAGDESPILFPAGEEGGGESFRADLFAECRRVFEPQGITGFAPILRRGIPGDAGKEALQSVDTINFRLDGVSFKINAQSLNASSEFEKRMDIRVMEKEFGDMGKGVGVVFGD